MNSFRFCQPFVELGPTPPSRDAAHCDRDGFLLADQHDQLLAARLASELQTGFLTAFAALQTVPPLPASVAGFKARGEAAGTHSWLKAHHAREAAALFTDLP
jgi:hypothetical protein